jgi:hypothetical protein
LNIAAINPMLVCHAVADLTELLTFTQVDDYTTADAETRVGIRMTT